jgi:hypothetical protein
MIESALESCQHGCSQEFTAASKQSLGTRQELNFPLESFDPIKYFSIQSHNPSSS